MQIVTILLFFVYTWGLGFTASSLVKEAGNWWERNLIRVGVGLGVFVVLGTLLNLLRIPLDWKVFLVLSLIYPVFVLLKKIKNGAVKNYKDHNWRKDFKLNRSTIYVIVVLIIFIISSFMYINGAFAYDYLEDDDPWNHAAGVKYVATEKTAFGNENFPLHYLDPYPPGYEMLLGILHQTTDSVSWTLKFFNGLIISLGLVFFYFFSRLFMKDSKKALFATFVLAAIPSFFTHFIWAHTLVIILFFPAMYCLEMMKKDKRWMYLGIILYASILLTQPSQALKLAIMIFLYFIVRSFYERKFLKDLFYVQVGGILLSLIWWGSKAVEILAVRMSKATNYAASVGKVAGASDVPTNFISKAWFFVTNYFRPNSGSASRVYTSGDFIWTKSIGQINVQVGWGLVISLLVLIALILVIVKYKVLLKNQKNSWLGVTVVWFIFLFLAVNAMTFNLPLGFITFRFWLLLAIPVALLSSVGLWAILKFFKGSGSSKVIRIGLITLAVIGIIFTAGLQKYEHNTNPNWPAGGKWTSAEELAGYTLMKNSIAPNSKVFKYTKPLMIFGFDAYSCEWCDDVAEFRKDDLYNKETSELHAWLKSNDYQYIVFGGMDLGYVAREVGEENAQAVLQKRLQEVQSSNLFRVVQQNQGMILLEII